MTIKIKMLDYPVSAKFGSIDSVHSVPHSGLDIATPAGTPAQSVTDGLITSVTNDPTLGENIRITATGGHEWVYGHLSNVYVKPGQSVEAGDLIGLTGGVPGTPGAGLSTGAHIHLATIQNGIPVNPIAAMNASDGGWLDKLGQLFTTPGAELAGAAPLPGPVDIILNWLGSGLITFIQIMPEVCGLFAMGFLLVGMCGSHRAMRYAGTSVLLTFVGVILNAAIG